jgi:hypothetical protein
MHDHTCTVNERGEQGRRRSRKASQAREDLDVQAKYA